LPSSRLHKATILVNTSIGRGYHRLVLRAPEISTAALPGQFVMLRVTENMDPLLARPFGISSLPSRFSIELIYRVIGRGTALLTQMEEGHSLNLLGPIGNGFPLPDKDTTPVLIAGGSGFPPLHFLALRAGPRAHLFLGARSGDCLPPAGVVKSFRDTDAKVHLVTEDGSAGKRGLTTDLLNAFLTTLEQKTHLVLYACGPHAMLAAVSRIAATHSLPCFVSMEERMACGVGACMGCSVAMKAGGYSRVCKDGPVFDSRDLEWGEQVSVKLVNKKSKQ
jgi:dihydroorotate dehydrogenase electron transfer subunit